MKSTELYWKFGIERHRGRTLSLTRHSNQHMDMQQSKVSKHNVQL